MGDLHQATLAKQGATQENNEKIRKLKEDAAKDEQALRNQTEELK
jgi:hypothetical protein